MTYQDILSAIRDLTFEEKLRLVEILTHSLREERPIRDAAGPTVGRLRGLLSTGGPAPSDADVKDAYDQYLIEKYTQCAS